MNKYLNYGVVDNTLDKHNINNKEIIKILYGYCFSKMYNPNLLFISFLNNEIYQTELSKDVEDLDSNSIILQLILFILHIRSELKLNIKDLKYYVQNLEESIIISYKIGTLKVNLNVEYILKICSDSFEKFESNNLKDIISDNFDIGLDLVEEFEKYNIKTAINNIVKKQNLFYINKNDYPIYKNIKLECRDYVEFLENITLKNYDYDKAKYILDEYGVCILEEYISSKIADKYVLNIYKEMIKLNPILELDFEDLNYKEWNTKNVPEGPRLGMYQTLVGHFPTLYKLRMLAYPIFVKLFNDEKLITSIDGMTFFPPKMKDKNWKFDSKCREKLKCDRLSGRGCDWPHADSINPKVKSYQGQFVLTNTSASFVCTPYSHIFVHKYITKKLEKSKKKSHFFKLQTDDIDNIFQKYSKLKKLWQVPIYCRKGSFILWKSETIHSSKRHLTNFWELNNNLKIYDNLKLELGKFEDYIKGSNFEIYKNLKYEGKYNKKMFEMRKISYNFDNWRCAVYITMRPNKLFKYGRLKAGDRFNGIGKYNTINNAFNNFHLTNHWINELFKSRRSKNKSEHMKKLLNNPSLMENIFKYNETNRYSELILKLTNKSEL
uniref:Uncharacterized protein n=1 Tax=Pithovirus LCDPAC02 TaxID=2506601 RepID=A0A481YNH3_9VIRU|nr:MAG: hypothetical protein LCDPAC02_00820 [Pithovirus LCDPAC02]